MILNDSEAEGAMRTIMPSQAVLAIDKIYPHVVREPAHNESYSSDHAIRLQGILNIVEQIPEQLVVLGQQDFADYIHVQGAIAYTLKRWISRGDVGTLPGVNGQDTIRLLRNVLSKLSDSYPPPAHSDLMFVNDGDVREDLRLDIGSAERALNNSEWKQTVVTAGAVIEDLLHWKLGQDPSSKLAATTSAPKGQPLDKWTLGSMIDVAVELGILRTAGTITSARLAQDYRNLIHPGRRSRKSKRPNRASAYSAIGAMHGVIDELG